MVPLTKLTDLQRCASFWGHGLTSKPRWCFASDPLIFSRLRFVMNNGYKIIQNLSSRNDRENQDWIWGIPPSFSRLWRYTIMIYEMYDKSIVSTHTTQTHGHESVLIYGGLRQLQLVGCLHFQLRLHFRGMTSQDVEKAIRFGQVLLFNVSFDGKILGSLASIIDFGTFRKNNRCFL